MIHPLPPDTLAGTLVKVSFIRKETDNEEISDNSS
jgi:hypothetical protein